MVPPVMNWGGEPTYRTQNCNFGRESSSYLEKTQLCLKLLLRNNNLLGFSFPSMFSEVVGPRRPSKSLDQCSSLKELKLLARDYWNLGTLES